MEDCRWLEATISMASVSLRWHFQSFDDLIEILLHHPRSCENGEAILLAVTGAPVVATTREEIERRRDHSKDTSELRWIGTEFC